MPLATYETFHQWRDDGHYSIRLKKIIVFESKISCIYSDVFFDIRRRAVHESLLISRGLRTVRDSGERCLANRLRFIYTRALKECTRHPVRAYTANPTTYWDRSREKLPSGRDARSRLRRKWRSWYICPRAITHLVLAYILSLPRVPRRTPCSRPRFDRLPHSALSLFSPFSPRFVVSVLISLI